MNWEIPKYAHIPLIHGEDGTKLSKRHGAINIMELKEQGYLPEAIINNLILLGWSPKKQKDEKIVLEKIIEQFMIEDLSKSAGIFSYTKLNFFNNHYLRQVENLNLFLNFCETNLSLKEYLEEDKKKIIRIFNAHKKDISKFNEMIYISKIYFDNNFKLVLNEKFNTEFYKFYNDFLNTINNINSWDYDNIDWKIKEFLKINNIKYPVLGKPLRFILTNNYNGASINDIFMILGKKESLNRLNKYKI